MLKNLMICGLESGVMPTVLLQLQKDKAIKIGKWIYDGNVSEALVSNLEYSRERTTLWRGKWTERDGEYYEDKVIVAISEHMDRLMQEFARDFEFYRESYYEYKNIINHIANEIYNELKDSNIQLILFGDIPHGPVAGLIYVVAEAMGIATLYIQHFTMIPGKFIYAHTLDGYGDYKSLPDFSQGKNIEHIEEKYEKNLFYMSEEKIKKDRGENWSKKFKILKSPFAWWKERKCVFENNYNKYEGVDDFIERKIIKISSEWFRRRVYIVNINKYSKKNIDYTKKYVYMPLHLQPEMTVDTIGGVYRDQILAIEKIRNIIPSDWYIYVKENPKQIAKARDKYFFKRLMSIKNVVLVDRKVDTYKLMEHSKFVATITGTAGWEAISGGKTALIFGDCWYKQMPGTIRYNENININDIMDYKWTHTDLEKAYAELKSKLCNGTWLDEYANQIENFDSDKNFSSLYESMKYILNAR